MSFAVLKYSRGKPTGQCDGCMYLARMKWNPNVHLLQVDFDKVGKNRTSLGESHMSRRPLDNIDESREPPPPLPLRTFVQEHEGGRCFSSHKDRLAITKVRKEEGWAHARHKSPIHTDSEKSKGTVIGITPALPPASSVMPEIAPLAVLVTVTSESEKSKFS